MIDRAEPSAEAAVEWLLAQIPALRSGGWAVLIRNDLAHATAAFAAQAVQQERERCAQVANDLANWRGEFGRGHSCGGYCMRVARIILGEEKAPEDKP